MFPSMSILSLSSFVRKDSRSERVRLRSNLIEADLLLDSLVCSCLVNSIWLVG
jgi:hypothetical protein